MPNIRAFIWRNQFDKTRYVQLKWLTEPKIMSLS